MSERRYISGTVHPRFRMHVGSLLSGRVALHADLTMLARLSLALARARAAPLAA
jgi:hypothetical protein